MDASFWIKRFFTVLIGAFVIIAAVQLLKGHDLRYSAEQAAVWALIASSVFTVARFIQSRRGQHCAICKDTPEMQQAAANRPDVREL
jgi:hypothetical protein